MYMLIWLLILYLTCGKKEKVNFIVSLYAIMHCLVILIHCFPPQNMFAMFVIFHLFKVTYKPM